MNNILAVTLIVAMLSPQLSYAQESTVTPAELRQALVAAATTHKSDLDTVQTFFSSNPVRKALKSAGIDPERVGKAVSTLSADELADLAARSQKIQNDFAAGALSNQQLTYIVIALGTALIVILILAR
jgi:preprotein translocase subunit SecF